MITTTILREWLIDYITFTIRKLQSDSDEFNAWAKSFEREEAKVVVDMEYIVDWGDETRKQIPVNEAKEYAQPLIHKILDKWYL